MKNIKYIILLLLLITIRAEAVPTTTINIPNSFSANTTIESSKMNANFNEASSKFNTHSHTDITQLGVVNSGTWAASPIAYTYLTLTNSIVNADISSSAAIVGSKLDLTSPGAIGSTSANTGAFSTLKVGTTNQGDILYDNGTSLVRLTPGTSGQVLKTNGSSANPAWANGLSQVLDYGTSTSSSTSRQATVIKVAYGTGTDPFSITNLPFTSSSSYSVSCTIEDGSVQTQNIQVTAKSSSGFTCSDGLANGKTISWIAIGI